MERSRPRLEVRFHARVPVSGCLLLRSRDWSALPASGFSGRGMPPRTPSANRSPEWESPPWRVGITMFLLRESQGYPRRYYLRFVSHDNRKRRCNELGPEGSRLGRRLGPAHERAGLYVTNLTVHRDSGP